MSTSLSQDLVEQPPLWPPEAFGIVPSEVIYPSDASTRADIKHTVQRTLDQRYILGDNIFPGFKPPSMIGLERPRGHILPRVVRRDVWDIEIEKRAYNCERAAEVAVAAGVQVLDALKRGTYGPVELTLPDGTPDSLYVAAIAIPPEGSHRRFVGGITTPLQEIAVQDVPHAVIVLGTKDASSTADAPRLKSMSVIGLHLGYSIPSISSDKSTWKSPAIDVNSYSPFAPAIEAPDTTLMTAIGRSGASLDRYLTNTPFEQWPEGYEQIVKAYSHASRHRYLMPDNTVMH